MKEISLLKCIGMFFLPIMLVLNSGCSTNTTGIKPMKEKGFFDDMLMAVFAKYEAQRRISKKSLKAKDFFDDKQIVQLANHVIKGRTSKIEEAVNSGVNINSVGKDGMTLLFLALYEQNKQGYEKLLELGASPDIQIKSGDSVMSLSAGMKDSFFLVQALKHGGNPDVFNDKKAMFPTPIYRAMAELNFENVKILVNANANIEQTDFRQFTPILYAANINQWHIVNYLLEHGANHKQEDRRGNSIAYYAETNVIAKTGHLNRARAKVIEYLKQRGIEVNPIYP